MRLSSFTVIRNAVRLGYPLVEALLSVLPYVDEAVVAECHSDDSTLYWCQRLQRRYPDKVKLVRFPWPERANTGTSIATAQDRALGHCSGDFALCVQADEIWHPQAACNLPGLTRYLGDQGYNGASFPFLHLQHNFQECEPHASACYHRAIRLVRNRAGVRSEGDGWTFQGAVGPVLNVSRDSAFPLPHPIYHCGYIFPLSVAQKQINHAALYPDMALYRQRAALGRQIIDGEIDLSDPMWDRTTSPFDLPPILRRMLGWKEYHVEESLLA